MSAGGDPPRVAVVSGSRSSPPGGLELAEIRLLQALRSAPGGDRVTLRVVGGRAARRHARALGGRWCPARPGTTPRRATRAADGLHMIGLDLPPPRRRPFIVTIHDLAALRFPDEGRLPPWVPRMATAAAMVVTPSRFTAREVAERLGVSAGRVRIVPNGPGHAIASDIEPLGAEELAALGLHRPFVLRVGGWTRRKNVPVLLRAWPRVRHLTGAGLALAGPSQAARTAQLATAPSLDGVTVLDYVPAALLPRILRSAAVLVSTSIYEGFGLPVLEAMAAGTPVVAVRTPAVEEVCGDAATLVDDDPAGLADALIATLQDGAISARLAARGRRRAEEFRWERSARVLLDAYRELV